MTAWRQAIRLRQHVHQEASGKAEAEEVGLRIDEADYLRRLAAALDGAGSADAARDCLFASQAAYRAILNSPPDANPSSQSGEEQIAKRLIALEDCLTSTSRF